MGRVKEVYASAESGIKGVVHAVTHPVDTAKGIATDISAANKAREMAEKEEDVRAAANGEKQNAAHEAVDAVGVKVGQLFNMVTLGAAGHVIWKDDVDYASLKGAKREGSITTESTVADKTQVLVNQQIKEKYNVTDFADVPVAQDSGVEHVDGEAVDKNDEEAEAEA